ncbi:hypothetical protein Nocox_16740 [Nonomuraea coxensis DSM 45129]|uniref:Protein kinase domain-containing protein n=1 Tax=Nonomuraea coxensis DSM 45129 TaxID=1122611 RepID=A0ABX8U0H7_9ACTN|nr:hypothetical protein [Nonomuraea coxensis]QYC40961.1 hypothetical protein Nocox_16740 [Nonomuraea coxensis DSM 45129]
MSRTDRATLTLGRRLGQGGQGTVHEVLNRRVNGQWDVVYKEYDAGVLRSLDVAALTAMTDLVGRLPGWDAAWLCDKTAWPAELVETDGAVSGFLMRAVPQRYFFDLRTLSGAERRPATLEFLLNDDAYVAGVGLRISDRDRLLLMADLAGTLARLHAMDIVVGDLSPKNLLFSADAPPECFLIDCDAMRLAGAEAMPQVETPDWRLPGGEEKGTPRGDAYKLALLVVRIFARDQTSTDPGRLAAVSPALADLAAAGLQEDPELRPGPEQWAAALREAAGSASAVPTLPSPPPPPPPPPGPPGPGGPVPLPAQGRPGFAVTMPRMIALGAGAAVVGLALVLVAVLAGRALLVTVEGPGNAAGPDVTSSGDPSVPAGQFTFSPSPPPTEVFTQEPTEEPTPTPTEEPFRLSDLDLQSSDPTPITASALLPKSFTTAKGVRYTLRAGGVAKCPDAYHDSNVRSALRKAKCSKMVKGAYVNPGAPANRRIMVSVWVVPLKSDNRAATAYGRLSNAYADDWGIVCPRKGPGSGLCHTTYWNNAQTWGWVGHTHRYLLHTMAIYTNRSNSTSVRPWLKDASKAAFNAAGPMVYHDTD